MTVTETNAPTDEDGKLSFRRIVTVQSVEPDPEGGQYAVLTGEGTSLGVTHETALAVGDTFGITITRRQAPAGGPGRSHHVMTDEYLTDVAKVYTESAEPKTAHVAIAQGIGTRTAERHVQEARRRGFLPPAKGAEAAAEA